MDKNTWISAKIKKLMNEGKDQKAAIGQAYGMWEYEHKKQEGGDINNLTPQQQDYFKNLQAQLSMYSPVLTPLPISQQGGQYYQNNNPYFMQNPGAIPNQNVPNKPLPPQVGVPGYPYIDPNQQPAVTQNVPNQNETLGSAGYQQPDYVSPSNTEGLSQGYEYDASGNIVKKQTPEYNDYLKYNILNPYGNGMDLNSSLAYSGQQFGQGHTGMGIAGAGLSALKGARSFLSGYASGKGQKTVEQQLHDKLYNNDANLYKIAQEGGKTKEELTNADLLTGNFIVGDNQQIPNVNVEQGEFTKNSETGQVAEVAGDKHTEGGENISLPNESKVLSDYTKIGYTHAKTLAEMFDIKAKAGDTFATVLDKYNNKIGVKKLEEQEKELMETLEKNSKNTKDDTTQQINEDFLAEEIAKVNKQKEVLNKLKSEAFDKIFEIQERVPKKGDGTEVLDKSGKPIKKDGGVVDDNIQALAEQYGVEPEKILQILQEGKMKQEGGQAQQGSIDPQQIAQALQQGADPNQVIEQLIQSGVGHEEAMNMVQQIVQQLQVEQPQGGQPTMQQGGTTPINSTLLTNFTKQPFDTTWLPYTPQATAPNDIWRPENYETKWKPLVQQTLSNPETAKKVDQWLTENKDTFSPNIQKQLEGLTGAERYAKIQQLATDAKPGLFHNAVLQGIQAAVPEAVSEPIVTTTPDKINRDVVKNVIYERGLPYVMPPSAPIAPYLQQTNLSRLEGQKGSVENQLAANEASRQALYASTANLPPAQRAALLASSLATSGQADTQGIAAQEIQDLQNKSRIEQYNAGQSDKEQILNEQLKDAYERKAFGTLNVNEQNWRNYYDTNQYNQNVISSDIDKLNAYNAMLTHNQLTGKGVEFVNATPFQYNATGFDPTKHSEADIKIMQEALKKAKAYQTLQANKK